jgi:hypothetical protein
MIQIDPGRTLRECERLAAMAKDREPTMYAQMRKLLELAEDLKAIEVHAQHLSSKAVRRAVGIGGRAARFVNRTFARRGA